VPILHVLVALEPKRLCPQGHSGGEAVRTKKAPQYSAGHKNAVLTRTQYLQRASWECPKSQAGHFHSKAVPIGLPP
jgi:hypothetical protein